MGLCATTVDIIIHEGYYQVENFFKMYTQTDFLKPIIDFNNFRNSMNFNFYVFDLNNQKEKIAAQPIRLEFKFRCCYTC